MTTDHSPWHFHPDTNTWSWEAPAGTIRVYDPERGGWYYETEATDQPARPAWWTPEDHETYDQIDSTRRRPKTAQCVTGLGWPESLTGKGNAEPLTGKGNWPAQPDVDTPPPTT